MEKIDLTKLIESTKLENISDTPISGSTNSLKTEDLVYIPSETDILDAALDGKGKVISAKATDYALLLGAYSYDKNESPKPGYWLRTPSTKFSSLRVVGRSGAFTIDQTDCEDLAVRPCMHLNLSSVLESRKTIAGFGKIKEVKDKEGVVHYHTIEFGEYPQHVAKSEQYFLDDLYENNKLPTTGKMYHSYRSNNEEYEYQGQKYVRVRDSLGGKSHVVKLSDGTTNTSRKYHWVRVEPIKWIIRNWDQMPKEINPNGDGTATYIDVISEECLLGGVPFNRKYANHANMWQNSAVRGLLNGINVDNIQTNGEPNCGIEGGGNYTGKGFLQDAFIVEGELIQDSALSASGQSADNMPKKKRTRIEKLNPDNTMPSARRRMTDTEMIKAWIDNGESVLLRGPSGIGKTQRLREMYPDIIELKLTDHMFPETVLGSVNFQEGQLIPPNFAREAIMQCANEEERAMVEENISKLYKLADQIYERSKGADGKVVILMDELLNVKPAVQSLVFGIVLNKIVESNGRSLKLPANVVIVATGNQQKFSSSASELASPLEKRFDHILDMEPKVGEWLYEYAIPRKLHPAVIGYIFSKYQESRCSEDIKRMGYFYEDIEVGETHLDKFGSRGKTNDPRGWTAISQILYNFEEDLKQGKFVGMDVEEYLKVTLESKLREEWATEFFDFYNHPTITVEDVVQKSYSKEDLPSDINEKFATMAGLLSADEKQIEACRDFVRENCDPEYLSVYDMYWAGNDEARLELIGELQAKDSMKKAKDMGFTFN